MLRSMEKVGSGLVLDDSLSIIMPSVILWFLKTLVACHPMGLTLETKYGLRSIYRIENIY